MSNIFKDIQNPMFAKEKPENLLRNGDMTVESAKYADNFNTPMSTEAIENPEIETLNKRKAKMQEKQIQSQQYNTSSRPRRDAKKINRPDELYENEFP